MEDVSFGFSSLYTLCVSEQSDYTNSCTFFDILHIYTPPHTYTIHRHTLFTR
jgi:hypothetical protein